jgi:hypothetical protein
LTVQLGVKNSNQSGEEEPPPRRKRSFFGKLFHGTGWLMAAPFAWTGAYRIKRSWSLIGDLVGILRAGPDKDKRFTTQGQSAFDLQATAFNYGMPVYKLEAMLEARRVQTARIAYSALALGLLFLFGWMWHALSSPWTTTRVTSALYFLPFCAVFFLMAFYNALLNFQIRSGKLASWREYLATSDHFWPR